VDSEITKVYVCTNVDCKSRGAEAVLAELKSKVAQQSGATCQVEAYMCFSACNSGPNVVVASKKAWFSGVQVSDVDAIIAHLNGGPAVPRLKEQNDPDLEQMIFEIIDAGLIPSTNG
jgi:(2Fe-2S) ferredoxin